MSSEPYQLYGMRASLYTGKVRAYLTAQQIDFVEILAGDPRTKQRVGDVLGRTMFPTLISPDGEIVQDSTDVIDFLERKGLAKHSAYPSSPRHRAVALLLNLYGMEGLLRPAMHYRWNFDDENLAYLESEFGSFLTPLADPEMRQGVAARAMDRMRAAGAAFGVQRDNRPLIEDMYLELLGILSRHLEESPYLLGGLPSWADYGLIGPFYGHLARDPAPSSLMKKHGTAVWRWTERMNDWGLGYQDHPQMEAAFYPDDAIPDSLRSLLRFAAIDLVPETLAAVAFTDQWLSDHPEVEEGTPFQRGIGTASFAVRGQTITAMVQPLRLHLLQKLQDAVAAMSQADQESVHALFREVGLASLLDTHARRRTERRDNRELWGPLVP